MAAAERPGCRRAAAAASRALAEPAGAEGEQGIARRLGDQPPGRGRARPRRGGMTRRAFGGRRSPAPIERQHRVQIVEGERAPSGMRVHSAGRALPAVAGIDAAQAQAPQQRTRIDQVQSPSRPRRRDGRVVHRQDRGGVARPEVHQRQVPVVVHRQRVSTDQCRRRYRQPARDRRRTRPCISYTWATACTAQASSACSATACWPQRFGTGVLVALLEPEGVHAEDESRSRIGGAPRGERSADAVAQHGGAGRAPGPACG